MEPYISVVIPLYNKERYIKRTLDAVLRQTFNDFEVVIIDDGSTDSGPDIVRDFKEKRIKLIRQENGGVSAARNRGIIESQGSIVAFLDSDDEWEENYLEYVNKMSIIFPDEVFFATGYRRKYFHSNVDISVNNNEDIFLIKEYLSLSIKFPIIHTSSVSIKKRCLNLLVFSKKGKLLVKIRKCGFELH